MVRADRCRWMLKPQWATDFHHQCREKDFALGRDVQMLAGHTSLRVTQRYINFDQDAQRKIVELI